MIGLTGDELSEHRTAVLNAFLLAFMVFLEIHRCGLNSYTLTLQCDPTVSNNAKIYFYCIAALRGGSVKPSPSCMDHVLTNNLFPLMSMFLGLPIVSGVAMRTIASMMAAVKVNATPTPGDKGQ